MSSTRAGRMRSWLRKFAKPRSLPARSSNTEFPSKTPKLVDPVENYYQHKSQTNLQVFYRFALQTRSIAIRDIFAKVSSSYNLTLSDLLTVIQNMQVDNLGDKEIRSIASVFDATILLTLADLIANTARDDLDLNSANHIYRFVYGVFGPAPFTDQHKLQYVEVLNEVESYDRSDELAEEFRINELATLQREFLYLQRVRRTVASEYVWLDELNSLYRSLGMAQVRFLDDKSLALMDRLTTDENDPIDGPKVSVIMPTYSPGSGICTAIRGLLEQTWRNLEIIVINDASPSSYRVIFDEIAQMDPRIRVIHQDKNAGAYVARNAGLKLATGDFITTHDDDDWSHPDKIASQVISLIENPKMVASTSGHIRTEEGLEFLRVNIQAKFMQMNYSSLLFRKTVINEIGNWDTVNRGGDSEFYTRLIEYFGSDRVINLRDKPLSFSRVWAGSLTSGEMSRGYFAYSRLLYRWAFRQWHWEMKNRGQKATRIASQARPYAVPTTFEAGDRSKDLGNFDVIYIADFFRQAKHVDFVINEMQSLVEMKLRVGFVHLNSPQTTRPAGFQKELFELQRNGKITQVSDQDIASANLLIVYDTSIGMFLDRSQSKITGKYNLVVHHELPGLEGGQARSATNIVDSLRNLDRCFSTQFKIVGAAPKTEGLLSQHISKNRRASLDDFWRTHIREKPQHIDPPGSAPVVGFHSFGNRYRWPDNIDLFQRVYKSVEFTTVLYGQLDAPLKHFGRPSFDGMSLYTHYDLTKSQFLEKIDFWVYYPSSRLKEHVWGPALEAMQAGKVVILPEWLRSIYGDAAIYCPPDSISSIVKEITDDVDRYIHQAAKGQQFVEAHYSFAAYSKKIGRLLEMKP